MATKVKFVVDTSALIQQVDRFSRLNVEWDNLEKQVFGSLIQQAFIQKGLADFKLVFSPIVMKQLDKLYEQLLERVESADDEQ